MAEKDLSVRSRFKLDTKEFEKIAVGVEKMRKDFKVLETALPKINTQLEKTLKLLQGISKVNLSNMGGGGGGNTSSTGGITNLPLSSADTAVANQIAAPTYNVTIQQMAAGMRGGGGGGGGGGQLARGGGGFGRLPQWMPVCSQTTIGLWGQIVLVFITNRLEALHKIST
jgi:hypothetical protein